MIRSCAKWQSEPGREQTSASSTEVPRETTGEGLLGGSLHGEVGFLFVLFYPLSCRLRDGKELHSHNLVGQAEMER